MGEASQISLKAIGKQDTHLLSKDPEDSFFNYKTKRHSDFRKYHRSRSVSNDRDIVGWPFGQTLKVQFNPNNMGDLLSNMWLNVKMPGLSDESISNYAEQLGRHIIKSATMFVDEIEIEKIHDDWGMIYDELYLEMSEKISNRFLVNRGLGYDDTSLYENYASYETELMIPLHFFFSRKFSSDEYSSNQPNRPYFPVCAAHKQKITFEFEFHKQSFFTNNSGILSLPEFKLITEEMTVSKEEQKYLMSEPQTLITDLVRKHPSAEGTSYIRTNLVPNIPVKCFHWFLRNVEFENEDIVDGDLTSNKTLYFQNRFNFSTLPYFDEIDTFYNSVMKKANLFINGEKLPNVTETNHTYFKYLVPFRNRLARPYKNIYTYSFSMNPINVEPSGNLDFSQIQSDKTDIDVYLNDPTKPYSLHMYYTGYQTFKFDRGFMTVAY